MNAAATVLLIEADDELRASNDQVLEDAGYQVEQLPKFGNPVTFAEQIRPNVIVMRMRPASGQVTKIVEDLQRNPRTATIPIVGYTLLRKSEFTWPICVNRHVTLIAPYSVNSLEAAVAYALLGITLPSYTLS